MKRTVDHSKKDGCCGHTPISQKNQNNWVNLTPFQEEILNTVSHVIFIIPCFVLTAQLVEHSQTQLQSRLSLLYGICGIFLYFISATYHSLSLFSTTRDTLILHYFHLADRFMIYIFIAASYMPWLLLQGDVAFGFKVAYLVWGLALSGVIYTIFFLGKSKKIELFLYLALGFGPSVFVMYQSWKGVGELILGGVIYAMGAVFYKIKVPGAHAIWHLFVAAGMWTHTHAIWINFYK